MKLFVAALAALLFTACGRPPPTLDGEYLASTKPTVSGVKVTPYLIDGETVPHILCPETPDRVASGTGVRISAVEVATAWHVVENYACTVDGEFSITVLRDPALDFAVLRTLPKDVAADVTCATPPTDMLYFLSGYADSAMRLRTNPLLSVGTMEDGMAVFTGFAIEGHSGGPVIGMDGLTYGIAVQRLPSVKVGGGWSPRAGVLLFRDTPICKKRAALRGAKARP